MQLHNIEFSTKYKKTHIRKFEFIRLTTLRASNDELLE